MWHRMFPTTACNTLSSVSGASTQLQHEVQELQEEVSLFWCIRLDMQESSTMLVATLQGQELRPCGADRMGWPEARRTHTGRTATCKMRHPGDLQQQNSSSLLIWGKKSKIKQLKKIIESLVNMWGGQTSSTGRHYWAHWSYSARQNQHGETAHAGGGDFCRAQKHPTANVTPSLGSLLLA